MLCDAEDAISYAIVATTFHTTIVAAMEGVIAKGVEGLLTGGSPTVTGLKKRKAQTISHRRPKGSGIQVERERRGWECVQPIAGVRKCERVKASTVAV